MRFLLVFVLMVNLLQAKKIALLIGNSDYSFAPLANPLHDVDKLYKTLDEIGFDDIKVLKNASKTEMDNALLNFEEKAQSAEIALIYFSGHGMQVNSINYMFPARTTVTKPIHLKKLVDLEMFIQSATSARYGIVLIDACRDNPLVKYFQNGRYKGASAKKGLGQVTPTNGQIVIGFATRAGETADDGYGNISPYAKALANRLKERDDIRNILGKVALDVSKKYNQYPIYKANLAYSVYLNKTNYISDSKPKKGITIVDGLMYQNQPFTKEYSWEDAKEYCKNLTLGGYSDWRLPTREELSRLANINLYHWRKFNSFDKNYSDWKKWFNKNKHRRNKNSKNHYHFIKKEFIENMPEYSYFWSSTEEGSAYSWYVLFLYGFDGWFRKSHKYYALCVR